MNKIKINYLVDSLEGTSLSTTVSGPENGWVEYCNRRGQLYYTDGIPMTYFHQCHAQVMQRIERDLQNNDIKSLGFLQHLADVQLNGDFVLPLFGTVDCYNQLNITVGNTRLAAMIINGIPANQLRLVFFVPSGRNQTQISHAVPLTTTAEFEQIYNLADVDYELNMTDCLTGEESEFTFDRSILKYSIYDKKDQTLPHTATGSGVIGFWQKHRKPNQNKIKINIRCTPEVEQLIQPNNTFSWDVISEKSHEWQWSFGKLLGSYRKPETGINWSEPQMHLWLYDITEPVYLQSLIPWVNGHHTCWRSKNHKAVFFDTCGDVTSLGIIGNWVH